MKIVHMEMNNRHVKPKTGGYFSSLNAPTIHSPLSKPGCLLSKPPDELWHGCGSREEWYKLGRHGSEKDTRQPIFV